MYSVYSYGTMIQPGPRVDAYVAALQRAIRPGCTVVDLGCGTGFFSVMACRLGAGRVCAIEPDEAITVAKEIVAANGYADRVEFIQDLSVNVSLSPQADVIVSDLRGVLPPFQQHIPSIVDVRNRLLMPGGTLIPRKDTLWAVPVESDELYRGYAEPWNARDGLDLRAGGRFAVNTWRKAMIEPVTQLADARCWAELDYRTVTSPNLSGTAQWRLTRGGTCHGVALWFDAELDEEHGFSNAPGEPELVYGQAFFPLAEPAELTPGETMSLDLHAHLVGDDYVWSWNTEVRGSDGRTVKARHAQSSFYASALSLQTLRKREAGFRPSLGEEGELIAAVLARMNGSTSLEQIARGLVQEYPRRFRTAADALRFVSPLAVKYSR